MSALTKPTFFAKRGAQGGFTLIELAIVSTLAAVLIAGALLFYAQQMRYAVADAQAEQLRTLNNAVVTYETTYQQSLLQNQPIPGVANIKSPTVGELIAVGALARGFSPQNLYGGGYMTTVDTYPTGCVGTACNVSGLTMLTSPITGSNGQTDDALVGEALVHAGGDAAMSTSAAPSTLAGVNGAWSVPNPLGAVAGILAMRSGYGSSAFNQFLRRDGSLPMVGTLNAGGNDIANAKAYSGTGNISTTATVSGEYAQVTGVQTVGDPCTSNGLMAQDSTGLILSCQGGTWKKQSVPYKLHRYVFTSSQSWTVPAGVTSAFVTMAGGGGSGMGWRVVNATYSGHSGGYVFNAPVNLVPGETMSVIVGNGGAGHWPYNTGVPVPNTPYYVFGAPAGDDGLGGYPGQPSLLISPSAGTLMECDGGSGATWGSIDGFNGPPVAGDYPGAVTGSGYGPYPAPNRVASGPFATPGGPGACGPSMYGVGNAGTSTYSVVSGTHAGGTTPLGYGSGGDIGVWGCYVSTTAMGTCIFAGGGRDGVVFIDVQY